MDSLSQTETLLTLILALAIQVAVLYYVIQEATFSKNTKKDLDAIRKLLAEIALKQGVESSKIEALESEFKREDRSRPPDEMELQKRPKWD